MNIVPASIDLTCRYHIKETFTCEHHGAHEVTSATVEVYVTDEDGNRLDTLSDHDVVVRMAGFPLKKDGERDARIKTASTLFCHAGCKAPEAVAIAKAVKDAALAELA